MTSETGAVSNSTRRQFVATALIGLCFGPARAQTRSPIRIYKDPSCGCCNQWADHLTANGFPVRIENSADLQSLKASFGMTPELMSCHTALIGNYVIEGHVPAHAIRRLLEERPDATGLAVPGMPTGSPGMEGGEMETYSVILFGRGGRRQMFGRYRGASPT